MWKGTSQSLRSLQTLPGGIRPVKYATWLLSRRHHAPEPEKLHLSRLSQRAAVKVLLWQYGKRLWKRPKKNGAKLLPWWKTLHVFLGLTNVVSAKGLPFHIVDDDCYVFLDWSHETERLDWMDRVIRMDTTLWVFYGTCLPSGAAFFSPEKYAAFPPGTPVVNRSSACSHERWKIAHLHLEQLCLCESSTNYIHLRKGNIRIKYTSSRQLDQPWTRPAEMLSYRRKHRAASSWRTREWRGGGLGSFERLDTCLNEFCASCSDRFSSE